MTGKRKRKMTRTRKRIRKRKRKKTERMPPLFHTPASHMLSAFGGVHGGRTARHTGKHM